MRKKFTIDDNVSSQQLEYELESVMHFHHNDFSRKDGLSTMLPLYSTVPPDTLGSSNKGTALDFDHINLLYCARKSMHGYTMDVELRYKNIVLDKTSVKNTKMQKIFHYIYSVYMKV